MESGKWEVSGEDHRRVVVVGAARQGTALARYLVRHGAHVTITDQKPADQLQSVIAALTEAVLADLPQSAARSLPLSWALGGSPPALLENCDLLCLSGGVPLDLPIVLAARARGIPLSNDSQIFLEAAPCKVIGITGAAGKTTTTTLVGRMASSQAAQRVFVGGNIGNPLLSSVDQMTSADLAVMELSSFQLELMTLSPQVAAITNITPNHLDRHGTMAAYTAAKAHILDFQTPSDMAVLNREDPVSWGLAAQRRGQLTSFGLARPAAGLDGAFLQAEMLCWQDANGVTPLFPRDRIQMRGEHNLVNVLAACAIGLSAGLPLEALRAGVEDFRGVAHRLEFVRRWGGADWYNDSIATAPERSMAAVRSFSEPLVLLIGGRDKHLPWDQFAECIQARVRHLVLFGEMAGLVERELERYGGRKVGSGQWAVGTADRRPSTSSGCLGGANRSYTITVCQGLKDAVQAAAERVSAGDVVLLSPGGTSFDEFRDFEARGEAFRQFVNDL